MNRNNIRYSIVIPVYNSDDSLSKIVDRLEAVFHNNIQETFEIIFVDDCSNNPKTWSNIQELVSVHKNITGIKLLRNFGKAGAQICGFENSSGDFIIIMDDDLQHQPEDIPLLIQMQHHDVVMGKFETPQHNFFKRLTSSIKSWFEFIALGKPKHIKISPFGLLNRKIIDSILQIKSSHPMIASMILYTTRDIVNVNVKHQVRAYGKSEFNFRKRWKLFKNLFINNSNFSLRMLRHLGLVIFMISMTASVYYLARKIFFNVNTPGFTTLVIINLVFGGLVLLSLGIIGEYIFRLLENVERKPSYLYRKIIYSEGKDVD